MPLKHLLLSSGFVHAGKYEKINGRYCTIDPGTPFTWGHRSNVAVVYDEQGIAYVAPFRSVEQILSAQRRLKFRSLIYVPHTMDGNAFMNQNFPNFFNGLGGLGGRKRKRK